MPLDPLPLPAASLDEGPPPNEEADPDEEPTIPVSVELSAHPHALVPPARRRWVLHPGESMSFGRGSPCDIRLAHDPVDEHVSRRAGSVEHRGSGLVVRNESTKRRLIVKPAREPERVLRPGETITCLPHREFLMALDGRGGSHYVLHVSGVAGGVAGGAPGGVAGGAAGGAVGEVVGRAAGEVVGATTRDDRR